MGVHIIVIMYCTFFRIFTSTNNFGFYEKISVSWFWFLECLQWRGSEWFLFKNLTRFVIRRAVLLIWKKKSDGNNYTLSTFGVGQINRNGAVMWKSPLPDRSESAFLFDKHYNTDRNQHSVVFSILHCINLIFRYLNSI